MSQWLMLDFICPTHGKFEKLCDKRKTDATVAPCPEEVSKHSPSGTEGVCLLPSPRVECYAVVGRMKLGEVSQGRNSESERPPHILDTRDLGDGMPYHEWEAKNEKSDQDDRWKDVKEMMA